MRGINNQYSNIIPGSNIIVNIVIVAILGGGSDAHAAGAVPTSLATVAVNINSAPLVFVLLIACAACMLSQGHTASVIQS